MIRPLSVLALVLTCCPNPSFAQEFDNIGLYADFGSAPFRAYVKACGYNTAEIADWGWNSPASEHETYYKELGESVRSAQADGFKTYILLLSNMRQRTGAKFTDVLAMIYPPQDTALMEERLGYLQKAVRHLKHADGFTFFAADPGGDLEKKSNARALLQMARRVKELVDEEAPGKPFIFNSWAIAAWEQMPDPFENEFWVKETAATKMVVAEPDFLGDSMDIEFPLHNYYRSLALRSFVQAGTEPEQYPTAGVVSELYHRGVKRVWGWPYFLIDEIDDGYSGATYRQTQAETRYLHAIVTTGRALGLNGMIGNVSGQGFAPEVLNIYAFARFCQDKAATPASVIGDFARLIATEESADQLAQVLTFIENHSSWEDGMPEQFQLPPLPLPDVRDAQIALALLETVSSRTDTNLPFPEPSANYLERLKQRLEFIRDSNITP